MSRQHQHRRRRPVSSLLANNRTGARRTNPAPCRHSSLDSAGTSKARRVVRSARLPCNPHPTHDAGTFDSGGIVVFWARRKRAGQTRRPALSNRETGGCVGCSAVTKAQARAKNRGAKPDAAKTRVDGVFSANRPRLPVVLGRSFTPVTWVQIPPGTLPFSCSHSPGWLLTAGGRLMSPAPCPRPARRRPGCASPR